MAIHPTLELEHLAGVDAVPAAERPAADLLPELAVPEGLAAPAQVVVDGAPEPQVPELTEPVEALEPAEGAIEERGAAPAHPGDEQHRDAARPVGRSRCLGRLH